MPRYITTHRGVVLPGVYNFDGSLRCFPIYKNRVKRLWSFPYHWFGEESNWVYMIPQLGLNAYQIECHRRKLWWFPYRIKVIQYLMEYYQFKVDIINNNAESVGQSDLQWRFVSGPPHENEVYVITAYSLIDNGYVGDPEQALMLHNRGIAPQLRTPDSGCCSIGFCEKENKWYGWSHRAIYSFGIGSKVKKGDLGYVPNDAEEVVRDCLSFYKSIDREVEFYVEPNHVRFDFQCGGEMQSECVELGRGEWVASTMENAREMACDFASAVS